MPWAPERSLKRTSSRQLRPAGLKPPERSGYSVMLFSSCSHPMKILPRTDLGDLQAKQHPAVRADQAAILQQINRGRLAVDASRCRVRGLGKRVRRFDAAQLLAGSDCQGFEGCPAIVTNVVETAVRCTSVKYVSGMASRTFKAERQSLHSRNLPQHTCFSRVCFRWPGRYNRDEFNEVQ